MSFDVRAVSPRSLTLKAKGKLPAAESSSHPLDHSSSASSLRSFASAIQDGTLTRPNLRRHIHARGTSALEYTSSSADDDDRDRPRLKRRSSSQGTELARVDVDSWASTPGASSSLGNVLQEAADISKLRESLTREVIVHEIQASDSLAGVALQYGVKVAALRKANKLWPSDSIHLRKTLYIPVDWQKSKASTWERGLTPPILEEESIDELVEDGDDPWTSHSSPSLPSSSVQTDRLTSGDGFFSRPPQTTHPKSRTKRIPISELSFFPPSTTGHIIGSDDLSRLSYSTHTTFRSSSSLFPPLTFGNGVSKLARMSTESLSSISGSLSLTRNSMSDIDEREDGTAMEMDAADDWVSTDAATSLNASRSTLKISSPQRHPNGRGDRDAKIRAWRDGDSQTLRNGNGDRNRSYIQDRVTLAEPKVGNRGRIPWMEPQKTPTRDLTPKSLSQRGDHDDYHAIVTNRQPTGVPQMSIPRSANSSSIR